MKKKISISKLLILIVLLPLLIFLTDNGSNHAVADPPQQPPGLEKAMEVQEAHTPNLFNNPEVVGTAVGLDENGDPVIKVFTLTRQFRGIPQNLEGFPVEVDVTGMFIAHSDPTSQFPRPVPIGVSTGHPDITAGTIGCRATDGSNVFALSNNHVYANSNDASTGDNVIQPGTYDGGSDPADAIGTLYYFEPIKFDGSNNKIDAAIAISSTGDLDNSTPSDDGYGIPSSTAIATNNIVVGMNVKKYGRSTGFTTGQIDSLNATVDVCYECAGPLCFGCKKLARFVNQIIITPGDFSAPGDSGSLIVTYDNNNDPVGLLFAGSSAYTIANDINDVFSTFGVTCDDGSSSFICNEDADCDDSDACNGIETCVDGSCQAGSPPDCDDSMACSVDSCDAVTGCINDMSSCCSSDAECDDSDACNGIETCVAGSCEAGTPVNCNDGDACTDDSCDTGTGLCSNDTISCDDGISCTVDSCDTVEGCVYDSTSCSSCTPVGGSCSSDADCCTNKCRGGGPKGKSCKE